MPRSSRRNKQPGSHVEHFDNLIHGWKKDGIPLVREEEGGGEANEILV